MKIPALSCALLLLGLFASTACSHMEVTPVGDSDRVLTGKVGYVPAEPIPAGAILSVRVVDSSIPSSGPVQLGQQRIAISGTPPFDFRVEYRADDSLLRRGVNVEAKILIGGKLRYANLSAYTISMAHAFDPQEITVQSVGR